MSFSGKQKRAALQEKRERDRQREQQEAARLKAQQLAQEQARERQRQEVHDAAAVGVSATTMMAAVESEEDDEDSDGGIRPVRRILAAAKPPTAAAAPTPIVAAPAPAPAPARAQIMLSDDDDDEFGGIVPVRRVVRGAAPPAITMPSSAPALPAAVSSAPSPAVASSASSSGSAVPTTLGAASSSANKLRTAFARESDEVIEARKAASRLPLARRISNNGGTPSEDYYARDEVAIPVRPEWQGLTPAELEANETRYFASWLETLYTRYGHDRLNHFEHNLEVWRQLWRVCERSDILVVVVDSRQPILNFPPSLYHYITRTLRKPMVLVLNKIDLLPADVVQAWIAYFHRKYPKLFVVPFTSFPGERADTIDHLVKSKAKRGRGTTLMKPYGATELLEACRKIVADASSMSSIPDEVRHSFSFDPTLLSGGSQAVEKDEQAYADADEYMKINPEEDEDLGSSSLSKELKQMGVLKNAKSKKDRASALRRANDAADEEDADGNFSSKRKPKRKGKSVRMSDAEEVREFECEEEEEVDSDEAADDAAVAANAHQFGSVLGRLEEESSTSDFAPEFITLGCIGQPNAGKSSLINGLAGRKLVSVSKTPGHTKYLQTLFLNRATRLCDCPGLVFPAVDMPRAVQVIAGSFPIAQTREPYSAVQFLAERLPLETIYKLTPPEDDVAAATADHTHHSDEDEEDEQRQKKTRVVMPYQWSAWSLCEALALKKGFFNRKGDPDVYRAANFILREVLDGVITLFFTPPTDDARA